MMLALVLVPAFLCAWQPALDDLKRALDARDDEAILQQIGALRAARPGADDRHEIARFLLDAARRETRLSIALELAGLAIAIDETFEGRVFLARLELKANEYAAAARHLDRALALEPENADALMARAHVAQKPADFDRAAALYEKAAARGVASAGEEADACREMASRRRAEEIGRARKKTAKAGARTASGQARKADIERAVTPPAQRAAPRAAKASSPSGRERRRLALREVGDANFSRTVHGSDKPAIVLFEAPWCRPCLALNAELARLLPLHAARVDIVSLNIDGAPRTREALSIRSIPQVLLFSGGSVPIPLPNDPEPLRAELARRFSSAER